MAARLAQIIAIEKGVKAETNRQVTDAHHLVKKGDPIAGIIRTHQRRFDDDAELPGERKQVQVRAQDVCRQVGAALTRLFDVTAARDFTNCVARADVVVDGQTLLAQAPVPYLLFLEKQLNDMHTFVNALPVLDPAFQWARESPAEPWATPAVQTTSTKKVPRNHVRSEATERHPAQVDVYMEDVVTGWWQVVKLSGAMHPDQVAGLKARLTKLAEAVKFAREFANAFEVVDPKPGAVLTGYLFGPVGPAG
jgi:hypothetical protein